MAGFAHANSRRMYSWWWDSHISPKNSKWLQENLTDMDAKVKSMIKLIEEDADSFARRAEMYYKKRPELMKFVEEFYRAYRALAERYDHATGVIRHAHRTMAEAFPNQVPPMLDDEPTSFALGVENQTADMSTPARAFFYPDELQNESLGSDDAKKNDAKFNDGKVRKSLKFHESVEKEISVSGNGNHAHQKQFLSESDSDQQVKASEEILILKKALTELEAEKEAGLIQYQQTLKKLSMLESEISRTQEDSKGLAEQASQAEMEAQTLKETLAKLESEKEGNLLQYRQCLQKISDLENTVSHAQKDTEELNQRASKAEVEAQSVKEELAKVAAEKDAALDQYMHSLDLITNLEYKLKCAEEDAKRLKEQAERAENEVEGLKQAISKLTGEKEAAELQYHQCLETISHLESDRSMAQEEAQRLNTEIEKGITNLKGAEERCLLLERTNQSLHSELEALMLKTGIQNQELTEKQKELGRLWTCIQEERLRFVEAETAFQTLQRLHAQAQEELRLLASELQNKVQNLVETETQKKNLHNEVLKVKEDNKNLNELSVSSAVTIKELKNEISSLTETKGKLEEELELRVDQRNALQQEIYCMKEELNDLNRKHSSIMKQVHAVGLDAECFGSSVRVLQDENSRLKENWERERSEKLALLGKLEILENLLKKNSVLENSLSDLNAELEAARGKIQSLEESCKSLAEEKSSLINDKESLLPQLQVANENLEELSEKNAALENFLCDAHDQLQVLKTTSMSLEESCQLLANEKGRAVAEKDVLNSQLESTQMMLENLEKRYAELGERYSAIEKEKESSVGKIQELQISLDVQKQEHANFVHVNELQLACMKNEVQLVQEEIKFTKGELDRELDNAIESQTEVFILRICAQDLADKNFSLSAKNQNLLELSVYLEGMLSNVKQENLIQKVEIMSLSDQGSTLRKGIDKLLKALNIVLEHDGEDRSMQDEIYLNNILSKLEDIKNSFCATEEQTLHQSIELSILLTMLGHLRLHSENLELEKSKIEGEFRIRSEQLSSLQNEALMLREMNEEMKSKLTEGEHKTVALTTQASDLQKRLMGLQGSFQDLQRENAGILEEKGSLTKEFLQLQENNHILEGENSIMRDEILSLDCLSTFLKNCVDEKSVELRELVEDLGKLQGVNGDILEEKGSLTKEFLQLQENNHILEGENSIMHGEILFLDYLSTFLKNCVDEKSVELRELIEDLGKLHGVNGDILEEKGSLTREFLQLQENNHILEGENSIMCDEILSLDCLSTFLKNCVDEKFVELRELVEDVGKLQGVNGDMSQRLLTTERKLEELLLLKNTELQKLHQEHQQTQIRAETLHSELQVVKKEVDMWEAYASDIFIELQVSNLLRILYKEKVLELSKTCEMFRDENATKDTNVSMLRERVGTLACENEDLNAKLTAYVPAINSLRTHVSSLEERTSLHRHLGVLENAEVKDDALVANHLGGNSSNHNEEGVGDPIWHLQDMQWRIQSIEKAVALKEQLMVQENQSLHSELEVAMRQVAAIKSENGQRRRNKPTSEIFEVDNGLLTKDIMLDQVSEPYKSGRREQIDAGSRNIESWEAGDRDGTIDLTVSKTSKMANPATDRIASFHRVKSAKKQKNEHPTAEILVEKELGVDKLEISKRFTEPLQEGNKRKVLERLNSDVQKLTNLQITVQDLRRKVEIIVKSKKGKAIDECDILKEQLEEANTAILKLFDLNGKLMKNVEDTPVSSHSKSSSIESEDSGSVKKRRVTEQARLISERIGRLQLEVQKIQFVLLKLDGEKDGKGKSKISEAKKRVLLRDYLYGYGVIRSNHRQKKAPFCGCVQPRTEGD